MKVQPVAALVAAPTKEVAPAQPMTGERVAQVAAQGPVQVVALVTAPVPAPAVAQEPEQVVAPVDLAVAVADTSKLKNPSMMQFEGFFCVAKAGLEAPDYTESAQEKIG